MSTSIRRAALESWLVKATEIVEEQRPFPRRWDEGSATETLAGMLGGNGCADEPVAQDEVA